MLEEPTGRPRQRLLDALAESIIEIGYPATTVTGIVSRARTSRRTFYDHFDDREACLVALMTNINRMALQAISTAVDPSASWEVQIRQAVVAWIEYSDQRAPLILTWLREAPALGPAARQLKNDVTEAYIRLIQKVSGTEVLRAAGFQEVPRHRAVMFIGGMREMSAIALENGGQLKSVTEDAVGAAVSLFTATE